jgi:hypothetical protein
LIPSVALLALLARALGCPLADLITKALPEFSVERGLAAQPSRSCRAFPRSGAPTFYLFSER